MPNMPQRACSYPGCPALVDRGRCEAHPYPRRPDTRPASRKRAYGKDCLMIRARYLREHPLCEYQRKCRGAPSVEVDHVIPLPAGSNDADNLRAACKRCHSSKTARLDTQRDSGGRFHARP